MQLKSRLQSKPKFKFRNKQERTPATAFERLVWDAVEVYKELAALESPPPYSTQKAISAAAFVRETLALARSSKKRIDALRKAIDGESPATQATLRRMVTFIEGPNCKSAPQRSDRLRFLTNEATTAELVHLGGYSTAELFALAAQIATERHPDIFGTADSSVNLNARIKELQQRRAELFNRINIGWTAEDILAGERDAPATFKLASDVPIAPSATAAERLVKALVAHQITRASSGGNS